MKSRRQPGVAGVPEEQNGVVATLCHLTLRKYSENINLPTERSSSVLATAQTRHEEVSEYGMQHEMASASSKISRCYAGGTSIESLVYGAIAVAAVRTVPAQFRRSAHAYRMSALRARATPAQHAAAPGAGRRPQQPPSLPRINQVRNFAARGAAKAVCLRCCATWRFSRCTCSATIRVRSYMRYSVPHVQQKEKRQTPPSVPVL